jgi:hypothetical protein
MIISRLKEKKLGVFKVDEAKVRDRIIAVMTADFEAEDKLNDDVRKVLEQHMGKIESGDVDYQKMFDMIKKKLAKDRGMLIS